MERMDLIKRLKECGIFNVEKEIKMGGLNNEYIIATG
jgi:hypothetical protein